MKTRIVLAVYTSLVVAAAAATVIDQLLHPGTPSFIGIYAVLLAEPWSSVILGAADLPHRPPAQVTLVGVVSVVVGWSLNAAGLLLIGRRIRARNHHDPRGDDLSSNT